MTTECTEYGGDQATYLSLQSELRKRRSIGFSQLNTVQQKAARKLVADGQAKLVNWAGETRLSYRKTTLRKRLGEMFSNLR